MKFVVNLTNKIDAVEFMWEKCSLKNYFQLSLLFVVTVIAMMGFGVGPVIAEEPSILENKVSSKSQLIEVESLNSKSKAVPRPRSRPKPKVKINKKKSKAGKGKNKNNKATLITKWFYPKSFTDEKNNKSTLVFYGKTEALSAVVASPFASLVKKQGRKKKRSKALKKKQKPLNKKSGKISIEAIQVKTNAAKEVADKFGFFSFKVVLPFGKIQLPVKISTPTGSTKNYILTFKNYKSGRVKGKKSQFEASPLARKKFRSSFGVGTNILIYSQKSKAVALDLEHQSFALPTLYFDTQWQISDTWAGLFSWKQSPGKLPDSDTFIIDNSSYSWDTLALDTKYEPSSFYTSLIRPYDLRLGLIGGFQLHSVPFLTRIGPTSDHLAMQNNDLMMVTFGGSLVLAIDSRWDFEAYTRYQIPLSAGSLFEISSNFAFDGSVGLVRKTEKKWGKGFLQWGLYWYGQWHDYDFAHLDNVLGSEIKGSQSLFFSNFDFRLAYSYDSLL